MNRSKLRVALLFVIFILLIDLNCLICKGEWIEGGNIDVGTIKYTKYWQIFNWWELIKIDDNKNFVNVWIKIIFKFTKPNPNSSHFELYLNLSHKVYDLDIYPKNNTNLGKYLEVNYTNKLLIICIDNLVVRHYKYYGIAIHYKIKKNEIITEKFMKIPIPFINSPEATLRYGLYITLNIDDLIPEEIRTKTDASIVHLFIALPSNTIEFHTNLPPMLVIPPKRFKKSYEEYFTKWKPISHKNNSLPFKIELSGTQPILYYVSGKSPAIGRLNYIHHDVYVEYTVTNYFVVWISFLATLFGFVLTFYELTKYFLKKRKMK